MNLRRLLFLGHRWLGIVLCLFMALWFVSGVVMMYVGYPKLTTEERLRSLPALANERCCVSPVEALQALPAGFGVRGLRLTSIGGEAYFIASGGKNRFAAVHAAKGQILGEVDDALARRSAAGFAPNARIVGSERLSEDAWTHSRAMDGHRPLFRIELADDELKYLYVSASTGEVVRDVSLTEYRWNWLGAWLHWLYPLRGGLVDAWWTEILIYTSLLASVLALSGLVIGLMRWRRQLYRHGSRSPYRNLMMRWHHWLGLGFGVVTLTWIASGLFSMNPWKLFDSGASKPLEQKWQPQSTWLTANVAGLLECFRQHGLAASELEWRPFAGDLLVQARTASASRLLQNPSGCAPVAALEADIVQRAGEALMPQARLVEAHWQTEYDWHYYARVPHTMGGHQEKSLPVLRLRFADPAETWLYLDPASGRVVQRLDSHLRVKRWLFALFHSWDWLPLLQSRPIWDVLLVLASLGGLAISLSGLVLGWRRLARPRSAAAGRALKPEGCVDS